MNINRKVNHPIVVYILTKLAALGLLGLTLCVFFLFLNEFDLYRFTETFSDLSFWRLVGGYALLTTMVIDLVRAKWIPFSFGISVSLHVLAGFIVFFPLMGFNFFAVIAGIVGAVCALIYALSCHLLERNKKFAWIFLLFFPLFLLVRNIDFTIKEAWNEEKTTSSYFAEFERFNGKSEIPIPLNKGDVVTAYLSFHERNGGGYGFHILDDHGELVEMENVGEEQGETIAIQFEAIKEGTYFIVITGDGLQGNIEVKWDIVGLEGRGD